LERKKKSWGGKKERTGACVRGKKKTGKQQGEKLKKLGGTRGSRGKNERKDPPRLPCFFPPSFGAKGRRENEAREKGRSNLPLKIHGKEGEPGGGGKTGDWFYPVPF